MGIFLLGRPSALISGFNGGITQVGVGPVGYQNSYEYLNLAKTFQGFYTHISGGSSVPPTELNQDGYPTSIVSGGVYGVGYIPTQVERSGDYKVTWDGSGTIYCPSGSITSGNTSTSGFTFTPNTNKVTLGISAGTNISNLKIFHVDDEDDILAGSKFGKKFIERLTALKPGRIRFMDWQSGNVGCLMQWKYRKLSSHICPAGFDHRPDLYAGQTTDDGAGNFSISFNDPYYGTAAPVHGQTFMLKYSAGYPSGTTPTLTINGHGPFQIRNRNGGVIGGETSRPGLGFIHTLVYDANFDAFLGFGTNTSNAYIDNGLPYEDMIDLCNLIGAHPHFVCPTPTAADGPTDVFTELATLCKTRGESWMKPAFETCNEIFTTSFNATQYSREINDRRNLAGTTWTNTAMTWTGTGTSGVATMTFTGSAPPVGTLVNVGTHTGTTGYGNQLAYVTEVNVGGDPLVVKLNRAPSTSSGNPWTGTATITAVTGAGPSNDWVGRTASMLGQAVSAVYADDRSKYDMLVGVQTGLGTSAAAAENSYQRIDATAYVLQGGSAAYNWVTSGTCAQYISTGNYNDISEMIAAYRWYTTGDSAVIADYLDHLNDLSGSSADGFPLPVIKKATESWKTFFSLRGVNKLCGYEGGYSNNLALTSLAVPAVTSAVTALSNASQAVVTMPTTSFFGAAARTGTAIDNNCAGLMLSLTGVVGPTALNCTTGTCTFTNGSATITRSNTFIAGQLANFTTNGILPTGTGFAKNTPLYIVNPTSTTFEVSTTKGGASIVFNTTGQIGAHTVQSGWAVVSVSGNNVTIDVDTSNTTTYPAYVSGGTMTYVNSRVMINKIRADAKQVVSTPTYPTSGLKGYTKQVCTEFLANTGGGFTCEYPSQFLLCASVSKPDLTGDYGDSQIWGALNDSVYTSLPCPMYQGNLEINAGI